MLPGPVSGQPGMASGPFGTAVAGPPKPWPASVPCNPATRGAVRRLCTPSTTCCATVRPNRATHAFATVSFGAMPSVNSEKWSVTPHARPAGDPPAGASSSTHSDVSSSQRCTRWPPLVAGRHTVAVCPAASGRSGSISTTASPERKPRGGLSRAMWSSATIANSTVPPADGSVTRVPAGTEVPSGTVTTRSPVIGTLSFTFPSTSSSNPRTVTVTDDDATLLLP